MCCRCEKAIRVSAEGMREDLKANRLEVVLIPSRDLDCAMRGGMIRAVQSASPLWYSRFCELYGSSRRRMRRKFDTKIKRRETMRGLARLMRGDCGSEYAERLKDFIRANDFPCSE